MARKAENPKKKRPITRKARGRKRTPGQREKDLVLISEWYCRGYGLREMAAMLAEVRDYTICFKQIHKDIQELLSRWREAAFDNVQELKTAELARIAQIEREAWDQWEASKREREKTETERRTGSSNVSKARVTREQGLGDARYLQVIQNCIKQRADILGINAPEKHQHEVMSWADVLAQVCRDSGQSQ